MTRNCDRISASRRLLISCGELLSVIVISFLLALCGSAGFAQAIPTGGPIPDRRGYNNKVTDPKAMAEVNIIVRRVSGQVYVVAGAGGNIVVFAGDDGVMLVDDNFQVLFEPILKAIRQISEKPVRIVVNTHSHGDHVQNNENFANMGAIIFAHPNTRRAVMAPVAPNGAATGGLNPAGWPVVTSSEPMTFHFNGEAVSYIPLKPAHTSGDVAVYFHGSDVFAFGDVYTTDYPSIGVAQGGTIENFVDNYNHALDLTTPNTIFVPGHGQLSRRADLIADRDAITIIHSRFREMLAKGMTLDEIRMARPSKEFDSRFATENLSPTTLQNSDRWYEQMFNEAKAHQAQH